MQDYNGRIKPMSTEAMDVLHKISGKDSMLGLSSEQILLGIFADPVTWDQVPLIKIKNKELKKVLSVDISQNYISFSQIFDENGVYKLKEQINEANAKAPSQRGTFDKDIIKLDERLNIFYMASKGFFNKFIPKPNDASNTWYNPQDALMQPWMDDDTVSYTHLTLPTKRIV